MTIEQFRPIGWIRLQQETDHMARYYTKEEPTYGKYFPVYCDESHFSDNDDKIIEEEPVGYAYYEMTSSYVTTKFCSNEIDNSFPVYKKQKPLSAKEIEDIQLNIQQKQSLGKIGYSEVAECFARAIEEAHGIK
jgi:hypothetical protein